MFLLAFDRVALSLLEYVAFGELVSYFPGPLVKSSEIAVVEGVYLWFLLIKYIWCSHFGFPWMDVFAVVRE